MSKILLLLITFLMFGCALQSRVTDVNNTFLEDIDISQKIENVPFEHAWVMPSFNGAAFTKVYFEPVILKMPEGAWKESATPLTSTEEDYLKESRIIARYFRERIRVEFEDYEDSNIEFVKEPTEDALVVKTALTEIVFSHPAARAAAMVAPVPGTGAALSTVSQAHMAMAMRLYMPDGTLVATAADRKFPPTRLMDFNQLTVTSSNREIVQLWAETLAEVFNKGRFVKTEEKGRFSWMFW